MLKYVLFVMLCLAILPVPVYGQEETLPPQTMPQPQDRSFGQVYQMMKPMTCNDTEVVENYILHKFGEKPFTYGLNYNIMGAANILTVVYVNPQSRSFSIVEHGAMGQSCILGQGLSYEYLDEELMEGFPRL